MKKVVTKKWMLAIHPLFAAVMLGSSGGFLIFSIVAYRTADRGLAAAAYTAMYLLAKTSIRVSTIGAITTGIILTIATGRGMFRFYWIIAKEVLPLVAIAIGLIGIYVWSMHGVTLLQGDTPLADPALIVDSGRLLTGMILQFISLVRSSCYPYGNLGGNVGHPDNSPPNCTHDPLNGAYLGSQASARDASFF